MSAVGLARESIKRAQRTCALLRPRAGGVAAALAATLLGGGCDTTLSPLQQQPVTTGPQHIQILGDTHWTNWSEYATGVQPFDFVQMWDPTAFFTVATEPTSTSGKVLQWSANGQSRNRWGIGYTGLGDNLVDQSVYTEFRVRSLGGGTSAWYMGSAAVRMSGTAASEGGYAVFFVTNGTTRSISMATWLNGAYTQLATLALSWLDDTWYSVRLEAVGTTIRAKVWARGTTEPATWQMSVVDTRWPRGRPGVSNHDNGVVQWDYWSVTGTATPVQPDSTITLSLDFADGVVGAAPNGWTETAVPANSSWAIASDAGASDGLLLRNTTTVTGRHILRNNVIPDTTSVQEVLVRMRMADADTRGPGVALRHYMNGSAENAYVAYLRPTDNLVEVNRYFNGAFLSVGTKPFANDPGAWYWLRFRADGPALKVKVWNDGSAEPAAWTGEFTDTQLAAGTAGLYAYEPNVVDYDYFGFANRGGTAPMPGSTPPPAATLTQVVLKPDSASVDTAATRQFEAYGRWSNNDSTTIPIAWTATGGTISATGLYTAGAAAGTFAVIATHSGSPALADTVPVTVTIPPPPPVNPVVDTLFSTGFTAEALGTQPAAWTETAFADNSSWTVVTDPSVADTRVFRNVTTLTQRHILRLGFVPDTTTAQEVLVKLRMADGDNRGPGIALRHTMNGTLESAYVAYLRPDGDYIEINRFVNGAYLSLGTSIFNNNPGIWYWMRFRAVGSTLTVRAWADGKPEPTGWTKTATDAGLPTGGVGLYTYEPNTVDYDLFSYAARGRTALPPGVTPPPPPTLTQVVLTPTSVALAPAGTAQFQVYGRWSNNDSTVIPVAWTATGGTVSAGGLFTAADVPGTFTIIATHTGSPALADTSSIVIAPPPTLTQVVVTPASATLNTGASAQFQVYGRWSNNDSTVVPVTWTATGGTVTAGGLYTAGGVAGTFSIIATHAGSGLADTSSITITLPPSLTQVVLTPASVTVNTGASAQFQVYGRWSNNDSTALAVTYSATGGTVTSGGLYTAGGTAGSFSIIATHAGFGLADTSAIAINVAPPSGNTWYTDFTGGIVGKPMPDLVKIRASLDWNYMLTVQADASAASGRIVKLMGPGTNNAGSRPHAWTAVPVANEQEVVVKLRTAVLAYPAGGAVLSASVNTQTNIPQEYGARLNNGRFQMWNYRNGGYNATDVAAPLWVPNQWMWIRLRLTGTQILGRYWVDGQPEPATWHITQARNFGPNGGATNVPAGRAGIYSNTVASGVEYGAIGAAINGATAPTSGTSVLGPDIEQPVLSGALYASNLSPVLDINGQVVANAVGQIPTGWGTAVGPTGVTWNVTDAGAGNHVIRSVGTTAVNHVLNYNAMSATADQEVLVMVKPGTANASRTVGALLRVESAAGGSDSFYSILFGQQQIEFDKWVNGTRIAIPNYPYVRFEFAAGEWYWLRARVQGNQLMARAWRLDEPEPLSWFRILIDNDLTSGTVGLFHGRIDTVEFDNISIKGN